MRAAGRVTRPGWFTEGFHTPDLQDAKALMDEIAGKDSPNVQG